MAERDYIEEFGSELAAIALALRDLPSLEFRQKLKETVMKSVKEPVTEAEVRPSYFREGMHSVNPYLVVRNGADRMLEFIRVVFNGEERVRMPKPDGSIMHAEIRVGDSTIEMGDGNEQYPPVDMALHVYVPDVDTTYAKALAAGAESLYPVTDQDYGDREAGFKDLSGNTWYLATHNGPRYVPEGLRDVNIYLHPKGADDLMAFVKQAFGAEEVEAHRDAQGVLRHGKLRIGDSVVELSEAHGQWGPLPANLHVYVPDTDETYRRALAAGAKSQSPPSNAPYGDRAAGVVDAWGNQWWIATYLGEGTN